MLNLISFLYRRDGRIRGGQFFVGLLGASLISGLALFVLMTALVYFDPTRGPYRSDDEFSLVILAGQIPGLVAMAALMARRLHDLGKSAIWVAPFFAYFMAVGLIARTWPNINDTWLSAVLMFPAFATLIWLFVTPGDPEDNRFGPPPTF